jgi:hypothetical protein
MTQPFSVWRWIKRLFADQRGAVGDLDELWEQPTAKAQPGPAAPAQGGADSPPSLPSAPAEPSPLEREVYQLRGMVQGLAQGMQPRQPEPAPQAPDYSWKDHEFLSSDDGQILLNGKLDEFPQRLNRYLNTVGKTVHENLVGEIQKRDQWLAQVRQESQTGLQQFQAQQQQQAYRGEFFQAHPDLQGEEFLVAQATQQVAQECVRSPGAYSAPQQILARVGEVARSMRNGYLQRWGGGSEEPGQAVPAIPPQSPARRAQVETGGSTRLGAAPQAKTPQQKALNAMFDHVKGRR